VRDGKLHHSFQFLGKEKAGGSSPPVGSILFLARQPMSQRHAGVITVRDREAPGSNPGPPTSF